MQQFKVLISGGGTGGHIFPALAIAKALEKKVSNIEILFVGATGKMEMTKIPAEGYKIQGLWISGLQRRLSIKNLSFPFKVISSLLSARKIIKKFNADIAIGTGALSTANENDNDGTIAIGHEACKVKAGTGGNTLVINVVFNITRDPNTLESVQVEIGD